MLFGMECSKIYMSDDKAYRKVIIMKAASISCLIAGFMLLWLCCVYAAQIKYEYFYDQQTAVFIGSEVWIVKLYFVLSLNLTVAQNQFRQSPLWMGWVHLRRVGNQLYWNCLLSDDLARQGILKRTQRRETGETSQRSKLHWILGSTGKDSGSVHSQVLCSVLNVNPSHLCRTK